MYKWDRNLIDNREICRRVKASSSSQAPLRPLPISAEAWHSVTINFIFGLARDSHDRTVTLTFVDQFSKTTHLVPVHDTIPAVETAMYYIATVFRHHGQP